MDAASRSCVVIDPLPERVRRLDGAIRQLDYRVNALLSRSTQGALVLERQALACQLKDHIDADIVTDPDTGWPIRCVTVTLADGRRVEAVPLGQQVLDTRRLPAIGVYLPQRPTAVVKPPCACAAWLMRNRGVSQGDWLWRVDTPDAPATPPCGPARLLRQRCLNRWQLVSFSPASRKLSVGSCPNSG